MSRDASATSSDGDAAPTLKFAMVWLGCAKNRVDAEVMAAEMASAGMVPTTDPGQADACVIHTCSFLASAAEEAVDTILRVDAMRRSTGRPRVIAVTGCLPQRYGADLTRELPEADILLGAGPHPEMARLLRETLAGRPGPKAPRRRAARRASTRSRARLVSTPPGVAYLKIAEGCSNACSYCLIPFIRGRQASRSVRSLVGEARSLVLGGTRELVLVAQDTTAYGVDLYGRPSLSRLIQTLARLRDDGLARIRILYANPSRVTDDLVSCLAGGPPVCRYLDIPIQHAHPRVLRAMRRRGSGEDYLSLVARLRREVSGIVLRTTVMVGFPGETEEEFAYLMDFLLTARFERLGAFIFSPEEPAAACRLPGRVDRTVAARRLDRVMTLARAVSLEANRSRLGGVEEVLIERPATPRKGRSGARAVGRTEKEAPEVDGSVFVEAAASARPLRPGELVRARIVEAGPYDVVAVPE